MKRSRSAVIVALAAFAIFGASLAGATTVQKFSISDLAKKSETIALAHVDDVYSRWDDNHKEIYTYISLKVLDGVKGSRKNDVLTIRQIGGSAEGKISVVPGMPSFTKGEEVVVFLSPKDRAGYPWVMGLQQGKYSVDTDANGFKQVWNDVDGLKVAGPNNSIQEATAASHQPLNSFLDGIRTELNADGKVQAQPTE
jgi:hypothetical protein